MRQIIKHAHLKHFYLSKVRPRRAFMLVTIIWEKSEGEPALVTARYVPYACSETVIELKRSVHNHFRRPQLSVSQSVGRSATANRNKNRHWI